MSKNAPPQTALKPWQRPVYGLPYLGYSIATLPVVAFIPAFYSSERGLSLAAVGLMIALTRGLDAVTDPLFGWISDRLNTPIGRRKPVILAGLPLLCLAAWMLFVPPEDVDLAYVFIWTALLYLGFTLVDLPFKAFGAELSPYYDERAVLAGWREGLGLVGTMLGLAVAAYVSLSLGGGLAEQLSAMAIIAIVATPILFLITLSLLREAPVTNKATRDRTAFAKVRLIWRNGAFRSLLFVSFVLLATEFGATALKALVLEHVFLNTEVFPVLMLFELIIMVASIPIWLYFSRRYSKHQVLAVAAIWGGSVSLLFPFIAGTSLPVFIALALLKAVSLGAVGVLTNGIAADVIDIDAARTGETRTGVYFALWGMINKGAAGVGVLAATNLPAWFGYQASGGDVEGATVLLWTFSMMPAIGFLLVAPMFWSWPLTRTRQARIRAAIDRRAARNSQT